MEALLTLESVCCHFGNEVAVDNLSFHINPGEIACLLGPSGCGKTTTLRAVAGFEPVAAGTIHLRNQAVSRPNFNLPPEQRQLGMVFQDYALFPHLTVQENVCFGLRQLSRHNRQQTASQMLELVGLNQISQRYPHELSGGQQQRVALARALAPKPALILLDEPFSNLDVELRRRLALEVRNILKQQGATALMVTHDQEEAFAVADKVGVMNKGRLQQWDTPYALYHEPANRFVAGFIGQGRFVPGILLAPDQISTELGILHGNRAYPWNKGAPVEVLLRPDDVIPDPSSPLQARILAKTFAGATTLVQLELPSGTCIDALFPGTSEEAAGETAGIRLEVDHLIAFPTD